MIHGISHGIGLAVHDPAQFYFGDKTFKEGDAFTIEPGIYVSQAMLDALARHAEEPRVQGEGEGRGRALPEHRRAHRGRLPHHGQGARAHQPRAARDRRDRGADEEAIGESRSLDRPFCDSENDLAVFPLSRTAANLDVGSTDIE